MSYYGSNIAHGKAGEKLLRQWFEDRSLNTVLPTPDEDKFLDIDLFCEFDDRFAVIGIEPGLHAVSIKRNDAGARYKNVCFELLQQERAVKNETRTDKERWTKSGWFFTGRAPIYAFIQYKKVYIYTKPAIIEHVKEHGWLRTCPLTEERRAALMKVKGYRYDDAICGYLNINAVPHVTIELS